MDQKRKDHCDERVWCSWKATVIVLDDRFPCHRACFASRLGGPSCSRAWLPLLYDNNDNKIKDSYMI